MSLPIIADVWRLALNWSAGGNYAENVIHVRDDTSARTASQVVNDFVGLTSNAMFETVSSSAGWGTTDAQPLDGATAPVTISHASVSPGGGSEYIPGYAGLVAIGTGLVGRTHRGRIYLPFHAENKQNDGQLSVSSLTSLTASWVAFATALASADLPIGVASYKDATFAPALTLTMRPTCGVQRRRQGRVI